MKHFLLLSLFLGQALASEVIEYSVPVSDALAPFATYPIKNYEKLLEGDSISLRYQLPEELVGTKNLVVAFEGQRQADGSFHLEGTNGESTCATVEEKFTCQVTMHSLDTDLRKAKRAIARMPISGAEKTLRLEVAKIFMGEPNGIMTYQKIKEERTSAPAPYPAP